MSGRTQTNPFQTEIPVPDDAEGLTRSLPEILRQVLNKIALLENDIASIANTSHSLDSYSFIPYLFFPILFFLILKHSSESQFSFHRYQS